jgi:hypothetical protein
MNKPNDEYQIVKVMLEQYTPYTYGVQRALKLLEQQYKRIQELEEENADLIMSIGNMS